MTSNQKTILACHDLLIRCAKTEKLREFYTKNRDQFLEDIKRKQRKAPGFIERYADKLTQP